MLHPIFELLRTLLIGLTGRGYDRSEQLNRLHHKLSYRLHQRLAMFGITGEVTLPLEQIAGKKITVLASDGGVGHQFIMYRRYEPFETETVRQHLKPGMVVYNIGANIGYYTILASTAVGPIGKVFAFEPSDKNYAMLQRNISQNGLQNVTALQCALSNESGTVRLSLSGSNSGDHQIFSKDDARDSIAVEAKTLQQFLAEGNPPPDCIIMDVQGAEAAVVLGGKELFGDNTKELTIFTELWPRGIKSAGFSLEEFFDIITANGARKLYEIDEKQKVVRPSTAAEVLRGIQGNEEKNLLIKRS